MRIIRATESDAVAAHRILAEYSSAVALPVPDDAGAVLRLLQSPSALWLATGGAGVVGCIAVRPLAPGAFELKRFYVRRAQRGCGVAGALFDAAEAFARDGNALWLYLDCTQELVAALRFYERRGFEPCARYNDDPGVDVFMRRRL